MQAGRQSDNSSEEPPVPMGEAAGPVRRATTSAAAGARLTRRRSSAGPVAPVRPQRPQNPSPPQGPRGLRSTFLALRDHGKLYVADLPRLSDGHLAHVAQEARSVLESLNRRLEELDGLNFLTQAERDIRIRAATKRDVTERFLRAIEQEHSLRHHNPSSRASAGESLARAFLQLARQRLPAATFDSLLQEALATCGPEAAAEAAAAAEPPGDADTPRPRAMPVVLTPEPLIQAG